jgi:signal transduction histidine kinase
MNMIVSSAKELDSPMIKLRMASLKKSIQLISKENSLHLLCREIVVATTDLLKFDRCGCFIYDPESNLKHGMWGIDPDGVLTDEKGTIAPVHSHELRESENESEVTVLYNKMLRHQDNDIGRGTLVQCKIYDGDALLGWLFIDNFLSKAEFTKSDIEFLELFSAVVGQLIVRQRQQDLLEIKNEKLNKTLKNLGLAQHELVDQKKMAALGHLVAGVAHELCTPIGTTITGVSHAHELVKDLTRCAEPGTLTRTKLVETLAEMGETLDVCEGALCKSSQLINQFKKLDSPESDQKNECIHLDEFIEERTSFIQSQHSQLVSLQVSIDSDIRMFAVPILPFAKVLDEIVTNAFVHAFHSTTNPTLFFDASLQRNDCEVGEVGEAKVGHPPNSLIIRICDNGAGMALDELPKLFDPFFTLNRQRGTGLGASILHQTVSAKLNGSIEAMRSEQGGLEYRLTLPYRTSV